LAVVLSEEKVSQWHYWTNRSRPLLMLDTLDYLLRSFNDTTDWNEDNFYPNLTNVSKSKYHLPQIYHYYSSSIKVEG